MLGLLKTAEPLFNRILARLTWKAKALDTFSGSAAPFGDVAADGPVTDQWEKTTLVTSAHADNSGKHWPVIDIDMPCYLIPSSTPGHGHLVIEHDMEWDAYLKLLDALVEAGIVQPGYRDASKSRKYSAIRRPGVKK